MAYQVDESPTGDVRKDTKARVFLSYSRKDATFVRQLAGALASRNYIPDFDQSLSDSKNVDTGISAEDEWWHRLQSLILKADVVVFIVSPDSAASVVCSEEIGFSRNVGKRIIPVLHRPINFDKAPPRLSALNVKIELFDVGGDAFEPALDRLCAAIDLDVNWYRESGRLVELATKWNREGRSPDRLMSLADISSTERLVETRPKNAEPPPQVLIDYREASRTKLEMELRRLRRATGRAFVPPAVQAAKRGANERALRLVAAGAALADDLEFSLVPELWEPAARAIFDSRTIAVLEGHTDEVLCVAFSPDGRRIVTTSKDGTARIWDAEGSEIATLTGDAGPVKHAAFSPNGLKVATASFDDSSYAGIITLWDVATGQQVRSRDQTADLAGIAFSPDGRYLAVAADNEIEILDVDNLRDSAAVLEADTIGSVSFSPTGDHVLAACEASAVIWDVHSWDRVAELGFPKTTVDQRESEFTHFAYHAAYSPDARLIATTCSYGSVIWDAKTGKDVLSFKDDDGEPLYVAFSADSKRLLATLEDGSVRLWDAVSWQKLGRFHAHDDDVVAAAFSPDGRRIVTASTDGTARLFRAESGLQISQWKAHDAACMSACFSPDGRFVLTGSTDRTVSLWDVESRESLTTFESAASIWKASFNPTGKSVVFNLGQYAVIVDLDTGAEVHRMETGGTVLGVEFSPNGRRIATASEDKTARVWDAETGQQIAQMKMPGSCRRASFSFDGRRIVAVSDRDRLARIWNYESGEPEVLLEGHEGLLFDAKFSPDGKQVLTSSDDGTARLWDAASGKQIRAFNVGSGAWVWSVAFDTDGRRFVTTSADGSARLYDASSGVEIAALETVPGRAIFNASFRADGQRLVTASDHGMVRIWDVSRSAAFINPSPVATLAAALARGVGSLTKAEKPDLLLQDSPPDLFAELMRRLDPTLAISVRQTREILDGALHPNCYLSETDYSAKFGSGRIATEDQKFESAGPTVIEGWAREPSEPETDAEGSSMAALIGSGEEQNSAQSPEAPVARATEEPPREDPTDTKPVHVAGERQDNGRWLRFWFIFLVASVASGLGLLVGFDLVDGSKLFDSIVGSR